MRLIDADELKKELARHEPIIIFNCNYDGLLADIIDNAPTVETHDTVNMYCDKDAQIIVEQIRPQGEWIYDSEHSITIDMYRCSVCGCYGHTHFNFCSNCGAEMRKEDNP